MNVIFIQTDWLITYPPFLFFFYSSGIWQRGSLTEQYQHKLKGYDSYIESDKWNNFMIDFSELVSLS